MRRLNSRKLRNQSTKLKKIYTIPEKTTIKKKSILQNSCPLKGLFSYKKKSNTLHFPNTVQFQPSKQDENLYKISSKSIKLSSKCNLLKMKENQIRYDEDKSVALPKIETPISNIMSKLSIILLQ